MAAGVTHFCYDNSKPYRMTRAEDRFWRFRADEEGFRAYIYEQWEEEEAW